MDFSIVQTDKSNPPAAQIISNNFIPTVQICVDVAPEALNNSANCLSFYHSRPSTAGDITNQYSTFSENNIAGSTIETAGINYNDLTSADGMDACLSSSCGACANAGGDTDNDGVCDNEDCAPNDASAQVVDACGICGGDGSTCADADNDGTPASTDPDDNDPCVPDNTDALCDSDNDGTPNGSDCAPNDASAQVVDACGICGGDGSTCTDADNDGTPASTDPDDNDPCLLYTSPSPRD